MCADLVTKGEIIEMKLRKQRCVVCLPMVCAINHCWFQGQYLQLIYPTSSINSKLYRIQGMKLRVNE